MRKVKQNANKDRKRYYASHVSKKIQDRMRVLYIHIKSQNP